MPSRAREFPAACRVRLRAADLIIHAGDHCDVASLQALMAPGPPVVAVHGNVDDVHVRGLTPREVQTTVGDTTIAVVHDAGAALGRLSRMRRQFPGAHIVVFGHSHVPVVECNDAGFLMINPGSPTDQRRQPVHTMAELVLEDGQPPVAQIILLDGAARDVPPNL